MCRGNKMTVYQEISCTMLLWQLSIVPPAALNSDLKIRWNTTWRAPISHQLQATTITGVQLFHPESPTSAGQAMMMILSVECQHQIPGSLQPSAASTGILVILDGSRRRTSNLLSRYSSANINVKHSKLLMQGLHEADNDDIWTDRHFS